jgi:hypothetical protein
MFVEMYFTNSFTSDKFKICLSQGGLNYEFQTSASTYQIANYSASASQDLFVGLDLEEMIKSNFAIIGEVSIAKNSDIIKNEGNQGNLFKALIRAINPSKPSIIGCVSVTFLSKSACSVLALVSFSLI